MKTKIVAKLFCFCLLPSAFCLPVQGQGTAFTYQGRLVTNGTAFTGSAEFEFTLWDAASGGTSLATNSPASVVATVDSNGVFTVTLDFGAGPFNGQPRFLQTDVRTTIGPFTTLTRQQVTATPYALRALNLTTNGLAGTYGNAVTFNNAANSFSGSFGGNGGGLTNVNASALGGLNANQFWKITGNSNTIAGANFLGTADNQPLEFHVNGARVLRIEPSVNVDSGPNMIGGAASNFVALGIDVATIGGGKYNGIRSYYGTIGGGGYNSIGTNSAGGTISGGYDNTIADNSYDVAIGGGSYNSVGTNSFNAVIGGGSANSVADSAGYATIDGGYLNAIQPSASSSTIGGGSGNTIQSQAQESTICGGSINTIQSFASFATIGGGYFNSAAGTYATVAGGYNNNASFFNSTVGGGYGNVAETYATVAGGYNNTAAGIYATVAGGFGNGASNVSATVGGGYANTASGDSGVVSGGAYGIASGVVSVVGGGSNNIASGFCATVNGGRANVAAGDYSQAAGRRAKALHAGSFVWGDSTDQNFSSTSSNQFLVRASGGVGIGTNSPQASVHIVTTAEAIRLQGQTNSVDNLAYMTFFNGAGTRIGFVGDASTSDNSIYLGSDSGSVNLYTAFGAALTATSLGRVGIDTPSPQTSLHVMGTDATQLRLQNSSNNKYWNIYSESFNNSGNLIFTPDAGTGGYIDRGTGNFFSLSDVRLKQDIAPLSGVLDRVLQLRPVSYHFRNDPDKSSRTDGLIAQEVEPLFPEVIGEHAGMKALAYAELVPVAVGAIQELNQKLEQERAENADLKRRLEALEKIVFKQ